MEAPHGDVPDSASNPTLSRDPATIAREALELVCTGERLADAADYDAADLVDHVQLERVPRTRRCPTVGRVLGISGIGHAVVVRDGPRRLFEWLFRDPTTGRITIAQFPNAALGLFLAAAALRWLLNPSGAWRTILDGLATGALIWWAVDELVRGVNPWRRLLGGAVLTGQAARFLN